MAIKRFYRCRGGNFSMMLALTLIPILFGVQTAIDVARLTNAKAMLQAASDSALLAASHLKDQGSEREKTFNDFLRANLVDAQDVTNIRAKLTVEQGVNHIETAAWVQADVRLSFVNLLGVKKSVTVRSGAYEATDSLEIAMVLDNTGSMGAQRMTALRSAARSLVDILENTKTPAREVRAALVPFVSAVNIKGEGFKSNWVDNDGASPTNGANFEKQSNGKPYNHLDLFKHLKATGGKNNGKKVEWKGCVEARPAPYNLSDTPPDPADPATLFVPYFAPDNPGAAKQSPNSGTAWNNSYLDESFGSGANSNQYGVARYTNSATPQYINEDGPRTTGPNYACPTPVQPLTDDFDAMRAAIDKMIYWEGGGTNVSEGLAWGMRVLSPEEPYSEGKPFNDTAVSKVVVVFTDGENTVFGASSEGYNTSDYGAYSFLDSGRFGTTNRSTALTNVNNWTQSMCTKLKDKGVKVFAVLLGADTTANRNLYSKCVSSPSYYFPTEDVSQLQSVFSKIGSAVAQLYLTN